MDAGDFSDSDAEYGAIDDDDQKGGFSNDDAHHHQATSKESIVFLVDCSPSNRRPMSTNYFQTNSSTQRFRKEEEDNEEENNDAKKTKKTREKRKERSYVQVALDAYRNVLRDRVVASPEDEIGLILYNTKERRGELEFDNVFVVHEIAPITAERVGEISNYIDTGEFGEMLFDEQIGTFQSGGGEGGEENNDDDNNAINHALWTASHMLSRNGKTRRSAYAFTCDDEVFTKRQDEDDVRGETTTTTTNTPEKKKMMMMTTNKRNQKKTTKEATIARCEEMANAGIKFELFPGPKVGDDGCVVESEDGEKEYVFQNFDVSEGSFWREVLRKFRGAKKKREMEELTRRRKIVTQSLKDAGDDEEVRRMLKEEEEAWMKRWKIQNIQSRKTIVKDTLNATTATATTTTTTTTTSANEKGEDVPSDEEECTDIVLSSKTRVENLEVVSRRKVNRRRPRKTRVWFNDGTFALPFTIVHLMQKTTKPAPKYVDAEDHQDLRTETVYLDKESGEVIAPKKSYLEIGPEKRKVIVKNTEKQATYAASKNFNANACKLGMHCLGFVDTSEVIKRERVLKGQGKYMRADETVFGGKEAFSALLTACAERRVSILCADVYNAKSQVKYVALIPQVENDAHLGVPAGFHVVRVPFRDDLRQPEKTLGAASQTRATETQIQAAEGLVESLELQEYHPTKISNPELQAHYKALEAIALNKRKVEKISDDTAPPIEQLWKEHGVVAHIRNFSQTTYGVERQERSLSGDDDDDGNDDVPDGIGRKRKASSHSAKNAIKKTGVVARDNICPGFEPFVEKARRGALSEYTVAELKPYLDAHGLHKAGNKAAILARIEKHANDVLCLLQE
tara:strand:- start:195 stop:2750 length:2556 start_codon:yes stop_codon:yes gene_type:complete